MFPFVRFGSCKVREVGVCLRASVMPDWQEVCSAGQKSKQGQSGGRTGLLFLFYFIFYIIFVAVLKQRTLLRMMQVQQRNPLRRSSLQTFRADQDAGESLDPCCCLPIFTTSNRFKSAVLIQRVRFLIPRLK